MFREKRKPCSRTRYDEEPWKEGQTELLQLHPHQPINRNSCIEAFQISLKQWNSRYPLPFCQRWFFHLFLPYTLSATPTILKGKVSPKLSLSYRLAWFSFCFAFKCVFISSQVLLKTCLEGEDNVTINAEKSSLADTDPVAQGGVGNLHQLRSFFRSDFRHLLQSCNLELIGEDCFLLLLSSSYVGGNVTFQSHLILQNLSTLAAWEAFSAIFMLFHVRFKRAWVRSCFSTLVTWKWFLPCVKSCVNHQIVFCFEALATSVTGEVLFGWMTSLVVSQVARLWKSFATIVTHMGVLYKVMDPFYVSLQMSARYDSLITLWTLDAAFYGWRCILNIECKSRDIHFFLCIFWKRSLAPT